MTIPTKGFRMRKIQSSNIAAVGFEGEPEGTLTVQFTNGRTYTYAEVPADVYAKLLDEAEKGSNGSVGKLFNRLVRARGYDFEEMTDGPRA